MGNSGARDRQSITLGVVLFASGLAVTVAGGSPYLAVFCMAVGVAALIAGAVWWVRDR